jgi:hypothetical protein
MKPATREPARSDSGTALRVVATRRCTQPAELKLLPAGSCSSTAELRPGIGTAWNSGRVSGRIGGSFPRAISTDRNQNVISDRHQFFRHQRGGFCSSILERPIERAYPEA